MLWFYNQKEKKKNVLCLLASKLKIKIGMFLVATIFYNNFCISISTRLSNVRSYFYLFFSVFMYLCVYVCVICLCVHTVF